MGVASVYYLTSACSCNAQFTVHCIHSLSGDLVSTLHQLGQMHTMAGDIDKAIESYRESLDVFREMHGEQMGPEMCITLGNLATMCYVKACICEEIDQELEMILATEQYFQVWQCFLVCYSVLLLVLGGCPLTPSKSRTCSHEKFCMLLCTVRPVVHAFTLNCCPRLLSPCLVSGVTEAENPAVCLRQVRQLPLQPG